MFRVRQRLKLPTLLLCPGRRIVFLEDFRSNARKKFRLRAEEFGR